MVQDKVFFILYHHDGLLLVSFLPSFYKEHRNQSGPVSSVRLSQAQRKKNNFDQKKSNIERGLLTTCGERILCTK